MVSEQKWRHSNLTEEPHLGSNLASALKQHCAYTNHSSSSWVTQFLSTEGSEGASEMLWFCDLNREALQDSWGCDFKAGLGQDSLKGQLLGLRPGTRGSPAEGDLASPQLQLLLSGEGKWFCKCLGVQ